MVEAVMSENRQGVRRRALKGARIAFNHLASSIDCVVRNMSDTGAAVAVESPIGIPDDCDLVIGDEVPRPCRVVWRKAKMLGLRFADRG